MLSKEDENFLKTYNANDYEHPSVTVDMLIFTIEENKLKLMLIKRKKPPYKDHWAIPGGFVNIDESVTIAAKRELKEETNVDAGGYLYQFSVYGEVNRDPRTRVISIAYLALIPETTLTYQGICAGDDAKEVQFFDIDNLPEQLAFDHATIIKDGLNCLRERSKYSDIAFNLLPCEFTMHEIQKVYEAILGYTLDNSNFRRTIRTKFNLEDTGKKKHVYQRPAKIYRRKDA